MSIMPQLLGDDDCYFRAHMGLLVLVNSDGDSPLASIYIWTLLQRSARIHSPTNLAIFSDLQHIRQAYCNRIRPEVAVVIDELQATNLSTQPFKRSYIDSTR